MIYKLKGIIDFSCDGTLVIDVGGVGYGVVVPESFLRSAAVGESAQLFIETAVREDSITLYGFATPDDKAMFNLLTSVQGVGPKAAMAIMSVMPAGAAVQAIMSGNVGALTSANGIGAKSAGRIVAELKEKVAKLGISMAGTEISREAASGGVAADAISALANMGYSRASALMAVEKALLETGEGASLGEIIRAALSRI